LKDKAIKGEIAFGTVDSWLVYNLTGGKYHVTDFSNASRTMIFNIHTLKWDEELLDYFGIPKVILPEVVPNSTNMMKTSKNIFYGHEIKITGIAGDQQSSLFGQRCFSAGDMKNTYGTGCFLLMNIGNLPKMSDNKLLTTVAWNLYGKTYYALEGAVFIGGAVVQWLRDSMKIIENTADTEKMAFESLKDEVVFIPAFSGLGTPYWDPDVRGAIFGITRDTDRSDIAKAALQSIAFQSMELTEALKMDAGGTIGKYNADGGATKNRYLMQFQADILQQEVNTAEMAETTALGAAFFAGLATGFFPNLEYIKNIKKNTVIYKPQMSREEAVRKYERWKKAVDAARKFK